MNGITKEDLYDFIAHGHEIEFVYKGKEYILQPEIRGNVDYIEIWYADPNLGRRLVQIEIPKHGIIPNEQITRILSAPCFNGKSFLEIEEDITVTTVY